MDEQWRTTPPQEVLEVQRIIDVACEACRKAENAGLLSRGRLRRAAARPERKAQPMRMGTKGPHGRPWIWLMAVIAVCLAPAVHPIAADVILTALAVWAMRNGR